MSTGAGSVQKSLSSSVCFFEAEQTYLISRERDCTDRSPATRWLGQVDDLKMMANGHYSDVRSTFCHRHG